MHSILRALAATLLLFLAACSLPQRFGAPAHDRRDLPAPTDGRTDPGESGELNRRDAWIELQHRRKPGFDWRAANNAVMLEQYHQRRAAADRSGNTDYADGYLRGAWHERGSVNQAGNVQMTDYDPATDQLYTVSDGGILWRRSRTVNDWTELNVDLRFGVRQLQVVPNAAATNGHRILTTIGKRVWYSDDEGATFTEAAGWSFDNDWGWPLQLVSTKTATGAPLGIYFTCISWSNSANQQRLQLYYSGNGGATFTLVQQFNHGFDRRVSLWAPRGSSTVYLLDRGTKLFALNGGSMTQVSSNTTLPGDVDSQLRGYRAASTGDLLLYAMTDRKDVWRSQDLGVTWEWRGVTPANAWDVGFEVSANNPDALFFGEVNCHRSYDAGAIWEKVNEWFQYYSNVGETLHADIMEIEFYQTAAGEYFALISNHGGLSISYDDLMSTTNLGLSGLNTAQYYDVRTDPVKPNFIYAGAQDQGYQRADSAILNSPAVLDFVQIISGDYGHMAFSGSGKRFWKQYPGGKFSYHNTPNQGNGQGDVSWDLPGTDKPNAGWIVPVAERADSTTLNKILVGGGNLSGGDGSYLIELTCGGGFGGYYVNASQDPYNFKPNSLTHDALISAIAVSRYGRRYVATSDGTFFRKNPGATTWTKTTGFNGPDGNWLYGACILPSKIDTNTVWFAGSGYNNPPVWKSTNGGQLFSTMNAGLPGTLVQEIAATPDETRIFAATDVGPYVYVAETNQWYPIRGANVPMQTYYSVEYVPAAHLVRFATYGRGIWDFTIDDLTVNGAVGASACSGASGSIDLTVAKGLPPYAYAWSTGAAVQDVDGLPAGNYTVTVTDANGFTQVAAFTVAADQPPPAPTALTVPDSACDVVALSWNALQGLAGYELRYRQGSATDWTELGNIGATPAYTLTLDPAAGLNYTYAVRAVCDGGLASAWAEKSGMLIDCASGVETVAGETARLIVSPNPASEVARVLFTGRAPATLRIYDAAGRVMTDGLPNVLMPNATVEIAVAHWPAGIYSVSVQDGKKEWVERLVVRR